MLGDAGCSHVILGHSERRHGHGESDATFARRSPPRMRAGLVAILCVGETRPKREAGRAIAGGRGAARRLDAGRRRPRPAGRRLRAGLGDRHRAYPDPCRHRRRCIAAIRGRSPRRHRASSTAARSIRRTPPRSWRDRGRRRAGRRRQPRWPRISGRSLRYLRLTRARFAGASGRRWLHRAARNDCDAARDDHPVACHSYHGRDRADRRRPAAKERRRRARHGRRRHVRVHDRPFDRQSADPHDGDPRRGVLCDQHPARRAAAIRPARRARSSTRVGRRRPAPRRRRPAAPAVPVEPAPPRPATPTQPAPPGEPSAPLAK